jgi:hypothetical protein
MWDVSAGCLVHSFKKHTKVYPIRVRVRWVKATVKVRAKVRVWMRVGVKGRVRARVRVKLLSR